eukprot:TRINITY_DN341_c0_g1_i3.p2 TRINITY_DN341_c0_g1~~TRINITY_DN341_c0_g1_i3.p2  ORF type:complete len:432 (+),score=196.90 TRINITY_DN341_c0_g1_i3:87-1298(+)
MAEQPTVIDVTERTPLVGEQQEARKASKGVVALVGLLALAAFAFRAYQSGAARALPRNFDDVQKTLPLFSFLFLIIVRALRELISGSEWEMGPGLKIYVFAVPYAITIQAYSSDPSDWGSRCVQVGVIIAVIAGVLDLLKILQEFMHFVNCAACVLLVLGCIAANPNLNNVWDQLPFWCWALTAGVWAVVVTLNKTSAACPDGFNDGLWVMVLATAAIGHSASAEDWIMTMMKIGCICGAVYAVLCVVPALAKYGWRDFVVHVAYVALFFPLCYTTLRNTQLDLDQLLKNIAFYAFAVTLGVRAIQCIISDVLGKDKMADHTDRYNWLFVLYLVLQNPLGRAAGDSGDLAKYADDLGQIGCLMGLVLLILQMVGVFGQGSDDNLLSKLRFIAELVIAFAILLA